ncbi:two-component system sensor histidine kinase VicK [Pedobacter sp. CG_S7]|uniref:PAS domain-containing sensor histidine kinase n=1 Tax=Pedobacter sp. CG_S7 TaxID=3143930 RepID=UPI003393CD38
MSNSEGLILKQMTLQSDDIFFIFNATERRFKFVNTAFEEITRRKSDELFKNPGLLLKIVFKDDLQYVKLNFKALLKKETSSLLNFRVVRPDKTERWISLKVYPIVEDGKIQYLCGMGEDETARIASVFNMQKINGWKNSTLEILSHDLRGPIGTVKMLASVIAKKLPENEEIHKLTELIEDISRRNINLINTVLKREALDTAEVAMSKERLDVVWEIKQVMEIYIKSQEAIHKKLGFTHSHKEIYVNADSMKFLQIINNLVSNAIKFTRENGSIQVHVEKLEKTFLVTVADDGIGIPRSLRPILFKKYTKAGRAGVNGEDSMGLGMWIVKSLTESHGGSVWFESEVNKGTKFYLEIPLGSI